MQFATLLTSEQVQRIHEASLHVSEFGPRCLNSDIITKSARVQPRFTLEGEGR